MEISVGLGHPDKPRIREEMGPKYLRKMMKICITHGLYVQTKKPLCRCQFFYIT
jgi:hypothetical protein